MIVRHGQTARARRARDDRYANRFLLPALSVLALLLLSGSSASPRLAILLVLGIVLCVTLANLLWVPIRSRVEVAAAGLLSVYIGVPFTRMGSESVLIALVLGGSVVITATVGAQLVRGWPRNTVLLCGLLAWSIAVTLLSPDPSPLLRSALLAVPVACGFAVMGGASWDQLQSVSRVVAALAMTESLIAVAELALNVGPLWAPAQRTYLGLPGHLMNPFFGGVERAQGTLGHPLPLGYLLMVSLALCLSVLRLTPVAKSVVACVHLSGLAVAGSRYSFAASLVLLIVLWSPRTIARRALVTVCMAAALVVHLDSRQNFLAPMLESIQSSGSYTHRVGAAAASLRLLFGQGVVGTVAGNGLGSNQRLYASGLLQADGFEAIDNQYVQTLAQAGLIGLLLLVAFLLRVTVKGPPILRPVLTAAAVNLAIFDVLMWPSMALMSSVLWGAASSRALTASRLQRDVDTTLREEVPG